jgi:alkanesulfonate monooxygenase SsuD/methylene tetrahydromethanopterin reductase-like flavin-dependent oxidoreductase (luciferase family)
MRFGVTVPNFGEYFHPRRLATLARDAEQAGWDGFFVWDHVLAWPTPMADPWVALAAAAVTTERIRLGPLVTPLPRRRPTKLAREIVSLDHLSDGRLILGVGTGSGPWEWDHLGEVSDPRIRGAMLDEGLTLLAALLSGEPVRHSGDFYLFQGDGGPGDPGIAAVPFLPPPVQRPRVPIWVAGTWPGTAPFRRAARWDGVVPAARGDRVVNYLTPGEVRSLTDVVHRHRTAGADETFDVVITGRTGQDAVADAALLRRQADAGATWWLEDVSPWAYGWNWTGPWPVQRMDARVRAGPPLAACS